MNVGKQKKSAKYVQNPHCWFAGSRSTLMQWAVVLR